MIRLRGTPGVLLGTPRGAPVREAAHRLEQPRQRCISGHIYEYSSGTQGVLKGYSQGIHRVLAGCSRDVRRVLAGYSRGTLSTYRRGREGAGPCAAGGAC